MYYDVSLVERAKYALELLESYRPSHGPMKAIEVINELLEHYEMFHKEQSEKSDRDFEEDFVISYDVAEIKPTGNFVPVKEDLSLVLIPCHGCMNRLAPVPLDYKPIYCCSGIECGCQGLATNPAFCDLCEAQIFDRVGDK
ncbi:hypothetical protein [Pseudobutyrivibrio sp.]